MPPIFQYTTCTAHTLRHQHIFVLSYYNAIYRIYKIDIQDDNPVQRNHHYYTQDYYPPVTNIKCHIPDCNPAWQKHTYYMQDHYPARQHKNTAAQDYHPVWQNNNSVIHTNISLAC